MAEGVIPAVTCGLARRSTRNRSCWMSWTLGTKRQSRIGSLGQLLREPPRSICSQLSLHCSRGCVTETRSAHPRSLRQNRRAWLHLWCAASALLPHQRPPILLARRQLPYTRTRLRNRAKSATGKTLAFALANAPVQFRSDLQVLQLRRPLHLLRRHPV
jgi:hypothetical protein